LFPAVNPLSPPAGVFEVLVSPPLLVEPCAAAAGGDVAPGFPVDAVRGAGFDVGAGFEVETFFGPATGFDVPADVDGAGCFDLNAGFGAAVAFGADGDFDPGLWIKLGFHDEGALPVVTAGFDELAGFVPVAGCGGFAVLLTTGVFGFCVCACTQPGAIARIASANHRRAIFPIGRMEFIAAFPPDWAVSQG
jgi:hypothetical protein